MQQLIEHMSQKNDGLSRFFLLMDHLSVDGLVQENELSASVAQLLPRNEGIEEQVQALVSYLVRWALWTCRRHGHCLSVLEDGTVKGVALLLAPDAFDCIMTMRARMALGKAPMFQDTLAWAAGARGRWQRMLLDTQQMREEATRAGGLLARRVAL